MRHLIAPDGCVTRVYPARGSALLGPDPAPQYCTPDKREQLMQ